MQPSDGCPSPSAEPTTPPTEAVTPESTCGAGECAPATPSPSMSEATTPLNGAPVTTTPQQ
ncbi:MAG: hypothetical protein HOY71_41715 [Nonomuraea sp.]|nr:hypothetical protein [Nonomuraea sp.]